MSATFSTPSGPSRWVPLGIVGGGLALLTAVDGPVLCPFRRLTGGHCPLCGSTRAVSALANFDPLRALELYPMLPLLLIACVLGVRPDLLGRSRSDRLLAGIATLVVITWVARLATGDIPPPSELRWPFVDQPTWRT